MLHKTLFKFASGMAIVALAAAVFINRDTSVSYSLSAEDLANKVSSGAFER